VNKTELIDAISTDTGLTRRQSEAALDALVYEVTAGVWAGNPVRITGFGTFKLRERAARRGRNPQTGAPVRIKASKGIAFTPGLVLKADLNARRAPAKPAPVDAARPAVPAKKAAVPVKKSATAAAPAKKATVAKASAPAKKAAKAPAKTVAKKAPAPVAKKTVAKKATPKR
jgi:DNA-binding protein HU-beta